MKAKRLLLALFFITALSVSAFGAWTTQKTTQDDMNDIDGVVTSSLATICAVGATESVEVSTDYGVTWTQKVLPADVNLTCVSIADGSLYVGGGSEVYLSTNYGGSWTDVSPGNNMSYIYDISFNSANNGVVCGYGPSSSDPNIQYTTNGGTSWNPLSSGTGESTEIPHAVHFFASNIAVRVGESGSIYKTSDGGANWVEVGTGETSNTLNAVHFADANNGFAVGNNGTVLKTSNGGNTWTATATPDASSTLTGVHFVDANNGWVVGYDSGSGKNGYIFSTANGGSSWTTEYSLGSNTDIYGVYFSDIYNGWAVGKGSGKIYGNITTLEVTSVVQTARPTQSQAPRGFSGNVDVTGVNFQIGSWTTGDVTFSGSGITVNSVTRESATKLTANISISASAASGARDVTVTNVDGSSDTLVGGFTVTLLPTISDVVDDFITPTETKVVVLTGTGFQTGATVEVYPADNLTIGTTTRESENSVSVTITAASATFGARHLTLHNPDGGKPALDPLFTVVSPEAANPTITDVSPTTIYQGTTQTMTVTGTSFESGATVTFSTDGLSAGSYNYTGIPTQFTFQITATATAPTGARGIVVNNPSGGIGTKSNAFFVAAVGAVTPEVTTLAPNTGYQGTSEVIQVIGSGFTDEAQGTLAYFNGSAGMTVMDVEFINTGLIKLTVNIASNATLGQKAITVINPDGGNTTKLNVFEVLAQTSKPAIPQGTSIIPGPNPWNPSKGPLSIQFTLSSDAVIFINIYGIDGLPIYRSPSGISVSAGFVDIDITLNDLRVFMDKADFHPAAGPYIIIITTNGTMLGKAKSFIVPWH